MHIETEGLLLSLIPFSEKDYIARIFTKTNGVLVGLLKGTKTIKSNKPLVGQVGSVCWSARLDSQLGLFHWELEHNLSTVIMFNSDCLKYMNAMFSLLNDLLPERENFEQLYMQTIKTLKHLCSVDVAREVYLRWELSLLSNLGYAMDLTKCAGCSSADNLYYISPRTGKAVCSKCGEQYASKLYKLPITLDVTYHFIKMICEVQGIEPPKARFLLKK